MIYLYAYYICTKGFNIIAQDNFPSLFTSLFRLIFINEKKIRLQ